MTPQMIAELRDALDRHIDPFQWAAEHMEPEDYETAELAVRGARNLLVELDARDVRIAALETRRDELRALTVRLTNEVPFPNEIQGWTAQRAAMIAEVGTLRARVSELSNKADRLAVVAAASDRIAAYYHAQTRKLRGLHNEAKECVKLAVADITNRDREVDMLTTRVAEVLTTHETSASIAAWQNETFGPATTTQSRVQHSREMVLQAIGLALYCDLSVVRPNLSRAIRATEELAELISLLVTDDTDPNACLEVADVQIVLAGIPAWHNQEQSSLVNDKMAVNRARRWNRTGDGHDQHVKEKP